MEQNEESIPKKICHKCAKEFVTFPNKLIKGYRGICEVCGEKTLVMNGKNFIPYKEDFYQ
jgi:DNA-directed RNA polymerase subunit RPC12/RpoP